MVAGIKSQQIDDIDAYLRNVDGADSKEMWDPMEVLTWWKVSLDIFYDTQFSKTDIHRDTIHNYMKQGLRFYHHLHTTS